MVFIDRENAHAYLYKDNKVFTSLLVDLLVTMLNMISDIVQPVPPLGKLSPRKFMTVNQQVPDQ